MQHTQPVWLEHAEREYGFGKVSVRGRHLRFEYIHSETGDVADSVDLKIGRSAVRSCDTLRAEGKSGSMEDTMNTVGHGILSEGLSTQQEQKNFLRKGVRATTAPAPLSSSSNIQMQEISVQ